jgi:hypothetical protein
MDLRIARCVSRSFELQVHEEGKKVMRSSLWCIVFVVACQSDSGKGVRQQADSKGPTDAVTAGDAAIDAGAPMEVEDDEPSKVDWILDQFCKPSSATDACDRCEAAQCCVTKSQVASAETKAYAQCVNACVAEKKKPSADCWIDCDEPHPEGTGRFAAYFGCTQLLCSGDDACGDSTRSDCDVCLAKECTKEYLTILGTREGFLWFQCNGGCVDGDGPCYQKCIDDYPNLEPDLKRMAKCQASRCSSCPTTF